jgi:hypothetical protein
MLAFVASHWRTFLTAALALALGLALVYAKALRAESARLALEVSRSEAAINRLTEDLKATQRALEQRRIETEALSQAKRDQIKAFEGVYQNDQAACDWGKENIPDNVYELLCQ